MFYDFLSQKTYQYLVLLIFSSVMASILIFFPYFNLVGSVDPTVSALASLFTASAGSPFFLISVCLLCAIPLLMKLPVKIIVRLWMQFCILLVLSFIAKTGLKHITEEPRPYTYQLQQLQLIDKPETFYALDDDSKRLVLDVASAVISPARMKHWVGETDYALPSGHTLFAAICVLFWGGFFWQHRKYVPALLLVGWATGVGASRIWLGMHWPGDLMVSIACAGLLYLFVPEALPRRRKQQLQKPMSSPKHA